MIKILVNDTLHEKTEKFDFINPPTDPSQLARDLAETMILKDGMGLSANQIGLKYRAFVMTGNPIIACFNPVIVDESKETITLDEGCLSFPGLVVKIKRPRRIKVRYTQPDGKVITRKFDDLTARIFQHEYMHMEGKSLKDYCSKLLLENAIKKCNKHNGTNYSIKDFK